MPNSSWVGADLGQGRYHVTEELGEGGMGQVYRAHDRKLDTSVVIKAPRAVLLKNLEVLQLFARENRSLVQLAHPHIVRILDVDEHLGVPFAVLSYLPGGSLEDRQFTPEGVAVRMEAGELWPWLEHVGQALDYIHSRKFVHRDVKPSNILFDEHGEVFLSDFGGAKALRGPDAQLANAKHTFLGTPAYLAPEVVKGNEHDAQSDQYSLAVLVYELLSGKLPYDEPTPAAVMYQKTNGPPAPLHSVVTSVSRSLSNVVHKALSSDPRSRFSCCSEFVLALKGQIESCDAGIGVFSELYIANAKALTAFPQLADVAACKLFGPDASGARVAVQIGIPLTMIVLAILLMMH